MILGPTDSLQNGVRFSGHITVNMLQFDSKSYMLLNISENGICELITVGNKFIARLNFDNRNNIDLDNSVDISRVKNKESDKLNKKHPHEL